MLNLQDAAGNLMDAFGDGPAVFGAEGESSQNEEIESALREVDGLRWWHGVVPLYFYRNIARLLSKCKRRVQGVTTGTVRV